MKKIKSYTEILESLKRDKIIYEKAMSYDKISKLKRLKEAGDFKNILKELKNEINEILDKCQNIEFKNIDYSHKNDIITILYDNDIMTLLSILKGKIKKYSTDEIDEKVFGGGWKELFLEIELDEKMLNRIDIINGLPNFMKGIGVGKKIYKKLIFDFGYVSTYKGYDPIIDSSMVWESLAKDKELFTFSNNENLIIFWNELDFNTILEKSKEFYVNLGTVQFDDDFLLKNNLTDKKLLQIIKN